MFASYDTSAILQQLRFMHPLDQFIPTIGGDVIGRRHQGAPPDAYEPSLIRSMSGEWTPVTSESLKAFPGPHVWAGEEVPPVQSVLRDARALAYLVVAGRISQAQLVPLAQAITLAVQALL